ncbi:MAG: hypothetical protein ACREJN_03245 [Nitrospiraceae bacterium]
MDGESSSLKLKVLEFDESVGAADGRPLRIRYEGSVEEIGPPARLSVRRTGAAMRQDRRRMLIVR